MQTNRLDSVRHFTVFFSKKLRLSNPWNYKIPFLICIPYFLFLISEGYPKNPILSIIASVSIIIGVAGFGYLTNDLGDRKKDELISKQNSTTNLNTISLLFLFVFFLSAAVLPWLYLPFNVKSCTLFLIEFLLFYIYAFAPFRLKERGLLGILCDASYAHLLPAILASYTFYKLNSTSFDQFIWFLMLLSGWQFVLGIRNILLHQIKDYENDLNSETKTFVTSYGKSEASNICKFIIIPVEVAFFIAFSFYINTFSGYFLPFVLTYWMIILIGYRNRIKNLTFIDIAYNFLDDLYVKWIPLLVLLILCFKSLVFIPVFILHFILFRSGLKSFLINKLNLNL